MDATEAKIFTTILIALGILLLFIIIFLLSTLRHQRKIRQLELQKMQAEITATEKDRIRIAADLHDELGPLLASARMLLGNADVRTADDQKLVDLAGDRIENASLRVREIAKDLMPAALLRRGLRSALLDFLTEAGETHAISIRTKIDITDQMLSQQTSVHIYRIVQEIVHNAIKHAGASEIVIEIRKADTHLVLFVKDNGKGFDQATLAKRNTGVGLRSIANRVDVLHGDLYIDSQQGTAFSIQIPFNDQGSSSRVINP